MKLYKLAPEEIKQLASRKGVRRIAVEDFLLTVTNNEDYVTAYANLALDRRLYNWNSATVKAIAIGIELACDRKQDLKNIEKK